MAAFLSRGQIAALVLGAVLDGLRSATLELSNKDSCCLVVERFADEELWQMPSSSLPGLLENRFDLQSLKHLV